MTPDRHTVDSVVRKAKRSFRRVLAHSFVNRAITTAVKPWARILSPRTLLRVPVTRIIEVRSPYCDRPVLLDTGSVDPIASMLYWRGLAGWEPETVPVFLQLVVSESTVLDVGANTGLFSLLAAQRSPSVAVHAIEPVPRVFDMLHANVVRNGSRNILCHRLALADRAGNVAMYVPEDDIPVMASLRPDWRPGSDRIDVEALTLDQFVTSRGITKVDVIKIDTEGTEDAVLAGSLETLVNHQPFVICEVLSAGNTAQTVSKQLAAVDYLSFLLTADGPRATDRVVGNAVGACHNYLFVPRSRVEQAQLLLHLDNL